MTQSRQALVARALKELNNSEPDAEDSQTVDAEVDPVFADLASRNIWQWGDPDQIDDDAFIHIAKILANSVATQFGKAQDEAVRLLCEQRLRLLRTTTLTGQPQRVDYY